MVEIKRGISSLRTVVEMGEMKPLEVGIIVEDIDRGHIVLRTASTSHFEIIDLTTANANFCWTTTNHLKVELLNENEEVVISLNNRKN